MANPVYTVIGSMWIITIFNPEYQIPLLLKHVPQLMVSRTPNVLELCFSLHPLTGFLKLSH